MRKSLLPNRPWRKFSLTLMQGFLAISVVSAADKAPVDIDDVPLKGSPVGKPQDRIGAGSRGGEVGEQKNSAEVFLLAPEQIGASAMHWTGTERAEVSICRRPLVRRPSGRRTRFPARLPATSR